MPEGSAQSRALPARLALLGVCLTGAGWVNARAFQIAPPSLSPAAASLPTSDVLQKYCVTCHNGRLKTAGLQLDSLDVHHVANDPQQWEKIITKLRTGEMPPPGRPRPDA